MFQRIATKRALLALLLLSLSPSLNGLAVADITLSRVQGIFAQAERLGETKPSTPARPVYRGTELLGYVYLTDAVKPIPAYSGRPITTLVGLTPAADIAGVTIVEHEEPILVIGVTEKHLADFTAQYVGHSALERVRVGAHDREGYVGIDGISGATITVMVLNSSIMQSAKMVANALGLPRDAPPSATAEPAGEAVEPQIWQQLWAERDWQLFTVLIALFVLLAILFFQDWIVRRPRLFQRLRVAYLLFTVFFIGFYSLAQLSIINVLAFMQILARGFTWETLLIDPLIFVLWAFVAASIILWGRGVYCGWLCPFGAMQELIHKIGEKLKFKRLEFPPMVHERLWAIKYLILLVLIGVSLDSLGTAARVAEVEPFKTAVIMGFQREWWFVLYAVGLLVIAAFNSKFYCKYLCPLGAALSFVTSFRVFDWLRRRKECGRPCQTCAKQCQISAIKPTGEINDKECHYCLECQATYWDEHRCMPLIEKRKRRDKRRERHPPTTVIATD